MKKKFLFLPVFAALLAVLYVVSAFGAEDPPPVVRVGYFDYEGFLEKTDDGSYTGYGYDYLEEISSYLGWRYEYVYGSWEQCLQRLADGEIDLLCTAQFSSERAALYDYAKYSTGVEYATLLVAAGNQTVYYNDYASFDGLRVGFMKGSYQNGLFEEFARQNRFSYQPFWFDTAKDLQTALDAGEIDAMLTGSLQKIMGDKAVAKFAPEPFYFITTKGNRDLMRELNSALEAIQTADADYNSRLYDKYYGEASASQLAFTREEALYIQEHPTLRMAYCDDWHPVSYTGEGNTFHGICAGMMELISQRSGIRFEYLPAGNEQSALDLLTAGKADLACGLPDGLAAGNSSENVLLTKPFLELRVSLSKQSGRTTEELKRIAVPENRLSLLEYAGEKYPNARAVAYRDAEACMEAVRSGRADAFLENTYLLSQYAKDHHFSNIMPDYLEESTLPVYIGMREDAAPALRSLLNKVLSQISADEINNIVVDHTSEGPQIHLDGWIRRYLVPLLAVVFIAVLLLVLRFGKRAERYAFVDLLTGFSNATKFLLSAERLNKEDGFPGHAVVSFDIDKFKFINNMHGFETGNQVLKDICVLLSREVGKDELFCREVNDHYFLLLRGNSEEEFKNRLIRLVGKVSAIPRLQNKNFAYSISCGVYVFQEGDQDIHQAIGWANLARERAKLYPRDWVVLYDDSMRQETMREQEITNRMGKALLNGEFIVYYQPKVRLSDEKTIGAEALTRWLPADGAKFFPDEFIPVFERNGFITQLDPYIFEQTCRQLRAWMDQGREVCPISVNLSRVHLNQPDFYLQYLEIMRRWRVEPHLIELEITEGTIFENKAQVASLIRLLKQAEISISIDDFGSGYSSLNLMKDLPFDYLKLDKEFFNVSADSKRGQEIIRSVIDMARRLHMTVIAEGVETREQVDFLKQNRCDIVQGYYFSRPLPADQFERRLLNSAEIEGGMINAAAEC